MRVERDSPFVCLSGLIRKINPLEISFAVVSRAITTIKVYGLVVLMVKDNGEGDIEVGSVWIILASGVVGWMRDKSMLSLPDKLGTNI